MPKIAVVGKGGAGKTMISSCIAYLLSSRGELVYAIDADPNPTLGQALGFPKELLSAIQPIFSLRDLIKERTGASVDSYGSYFTLNPSVKDIPERYSALYRSIRLLIMGTTRAANAGCACAENALVKALVNHLVLQSKETVIMDMVAGTEHLGRGTAAGVDAMIAVVEPSMRSIQAALSIVNLTNQLTKCKLWIVGNKIQSHDDKKLIENNFGNCTIAGYVSWNQKILKSENSERVVYDMVPETVNEIRSILDHVTI